MHSIYKYPFLFFAVACHAFPYSYNIKQKILNILWQINTKSIITLLLLTLFITFYFSGILFSYVC